MIEHDELAARIAGGEQVIGEDELRIRIVGLGLDRRIGRSRQRATIVMRPPAARRAPRR